MFCFSCPFFFCVLMDGNALSAGMYALMVGCSADEFFLPPPSTLSLCLLPPVQIRVFKLGFAEVSISSSTFTNFCC
ncbi:hypothetical protein ABFX02_05G097700 [Erythranthe guttata]